MTPTARLALLLPLANGDPLEASDIGKLVFRFLHRFAAVGLRLRRGEGELWDVRSATPHELTHVACAVRRVFTAGFMFDGPRHIGTEEIGPDDVRQPLAFPSLRFGVFVPPKRRRAERFTQIIEAARLQDLVPYLTMYLLATEAIAIHRCPAPAPRNWKERCNRFFVVGGHGRPSNTCGKACADRVKAKRVYQQRRRERLAWKAAHPQAVGHRVKR